MARAKQASKRKRQRIALPILGVAGVSLAMAGGASATAPTANVPSQDTEPRPVITLGEEEISDVSLATFYVFDKENAGTSQLGQGIKLAAARGCGCRGGGGCAAARGCGGCGSTRLQRLRSRQRLRRLRSGRLRRLRRLGLRGLRRLRRRLRTDCWRWTPLGWVPVC